MENKNTMFENKLYVGNISYRVKSADLKELFEKAGTVLSATIIIHKLTGKSKGFGFVEMSTAEELDKAIEMFNHYELMDRPITVNYAKPVNKDMTQSY
jgi:RNA recognition motif-containing protein